MTLFYSFFTTLEGKEVVVELKNDVALRGILQSVDQYLNIKLDNVSVVDADAYPQLVRRPRSWLLLAELRCARFPVGCGSAGALFAGASAARA
jgi:U6 snRNA-associated Sm-like protein LSm2